MAVKQIVYKNKILALIIRPSRTKKGTTFYTPDDYVLQVGWHNHPKGKIINPHRHLPVRTQRIGSLQEVLYVEKGKVRITFYTKQGIKIDAQTLRRGDIILLMEDGHGFKFSENTGLLEIKQGPYHPQSREPLTIKG